MRDLRKMTPKQLEEYTTRWLQQNDKTPKQRHEDGPATEWTLSPVSVDECCEDEDALEIASTFADLSGGRLSTIMCAALSDEHHRGLEARREYMRETRAHRPDKRREWREREKLRRRKARALARAAVEREAAHQQRREAQSPTPVRGRKTRIDSRQLGLPWAA